MVHSITARAAYSRCRARVLAHCRKAALPRPVKPRPCSSRSPVAKKAIMVHAWRRALDAAPPVAAPSPAETDDPAEQWKALRAVLQQADEVADAIRSNLRAQASQYVQ